MTKRYTRKRDSTTLLDMFNDLVKRYVFKRMYKVLKNKNNI